MRLWHEALLPYLPRQQLLGQHRECCALRGKGWGRPHSTVNYVFDHPLSWLWIYHWKVMKEMVKRGYTPDYNWFDFRYRGKHLPLLSSNDSSGLIDRDQLDNKVKYLVYPEHDDKYLDECLANLDKKGIHIDLGKEN